MTLLRRLADHALELHPDRATTVLERLDEQEAIQLLERASITVAATILGRLSPQYATSVLQGMKLDRAARIVGLLPLDAATRLVRRTDDTAQGKILDHLESKRARSIRAVLRYPEGSAGALMDPDVLALPQELTAREVVRRLRKAADFVRYNMYVVDQTQVLVGVLTLRELFLARGGLQLTDLMVRDPSRILATAESARILEHPAWKQVHALPVVDEADAFVGVIRYRTFRELEGRLVAPRGQDVDTGTAFGQVIAVGALGLLDAFSSAAPLGEKRKRGA